MLLAVGPGSQKMSNSFENARRHLLPAGELEQLTRPSGNDTLLALDLNVTCKDATLRAECFPIVINSEIIWKRRTKCRNPAQAEKQIDLEHVGSIRVPQRGRYESTLLFTKSSILDISLLIT